MLTSSYTIGPAQADGRWYVSETHVAEDGRSFPYEYLSDGSLDPQMVLEERAVVIAATLAAREAARLAVVGTAVPYTKHEFLSRFTSAERIAVRVASRTNENVLDFVEMLNASGGVHMVLARPGLQYLAAIGNLTAERAAEIGVE